MAATSHLVLTTAGQKYEVSPETGNTIAQAMTDGNVSLITFSTFANRKQVRMATAHIVAVEIEA